jgi:hypothetical protein
LATTERPTGNKKAKAQRAAISFGMMQESIARCISEVSSTSTQSELGDKNIDERLTTYFGCKIRGFKLVRIRIEEAKVST